ncbi:BirA family biotin operon repressor/biotin-[acetyl-CoA-carboxylase] ligase [Clostridiales Family XIII bacterium PM5-7]
MSTKSDLLKLLQLHTGAFLSGQKIGEELHVSRNAIWKAIEQLKVEGYSIESKTRMGYRLKSNSNMLSTAGISGHLRVPCDLQIYDTVDSTNNVAKTLVPRSKPTVILANKQTDGRGRLGRSFASPAGTGLYLTISLKPDFDLDKALYVTMAAAVAVCRGIQTVVGVSGKIKWVNDIFCDNRKVCGILTEAQTNFETGKIDNLIIGIGINCFPGNFPEELSDQIGCLSPVKNSFSRNQLAAEIINETMEILDDLQSKRFLREYRTKCFILGKNIIVHPNLNGEKAYKARAIDIDENGGLVIEHMGGLMARQMETLTTGEISIKIES